MTSQEEIWKPIPEFLGYEASDQGRVRSFKKVVKKKGWIIADAPQRILKPSRSQKYLGVLLRSNGKTCRRKIAQLVLFAFVGPRPEGMEACHNNGNPSDNRLENLRYDTRSGNARDAVEHGAIGTLNEAEVVKIRELCADNVKYKQIAKRFGYSTSHIQGICRGDAYHRFGGPRTTKGHRQGKLNTEKAGEIRRKHRNGETQQSLADEFNVHYSTISLICSNKRWIETNP